MDKIEAETTFRRPPWRDLTLTEYVKKRNGVPLGHSESLRNMLRRSLGAGSFAQFWQYWNPIWGYGLGKYVYTPLQRLLPPALALIVTFGVSGAIHDLVMITLRRSAIFLFIPWFLLLGAGVVLGRGLRIDYSHRPWPVRVAINLAYLFLCLALTLMAKEFFNIP